ncbi:uncharacterized protein EAE98_000033 [Botrytis deweyae]|uniref:Aminoglycoside phosphotransferase domain-containing protein n=2 Tax=Botrytis TaxID=33196 RepID=A0A4Z1K2N0_9HELO|nr:uncharacterized protein EAE98_000033 [Botrytis deweyae]KAF7920124.1 hypothetical protein EAE99_008245 [Botrytis elliptica]KAF7939906.1 hypothetical protein EAE98_000033 [Botrytis deweyae]TGO79816.1 hypothetical protein BELL_0022g00270 [Botrytis elliptica]
MASYKTAVPGKSFKTSLMYSVPVRRLKEILSHVVPDMKLGSVEELPSTQLPRLYTLNMSNDNKLLLSFAPSLAVRLLRHETTLQYSEATLVHFLDTSCQKANGMEDVEHDLASIKLEDVIPKMLKHSSNNREMALPYTIFEPTAGKTLSALSVYLSLPDRRLIDKQVGSLTRSLASLTSPNGTFGTAARVLPDPFKQSPPSAPLGSGSPTWSEAFNTLLESILRDGEDMAVLLPYDVVRSHYQRLSWRMDAVKLPRLVLLDLGERNVMIENGIKEGSSHIPTESLKLTGLRNWSQGVFGDPLLSNVFENPSEGFMEGWKAGDEDDLIEDTGNAEVRLLLYRCYRAVLGIVTEYYRPQNDSSRRELENRRNLTAALSELEKVDVAVNDMLKRARSLSSSVAPEAESSKRQKIGIEDLVDEN